MNKILHWLPRILSILITAFWAFFVFAAHGLSIATLMESGIWIALLVFTVLAWRGQLTGKLGFLIMGALYVIMARGKMPYATVLIVAGPVLLIGLLYFLEDFFKNKQISLKPFKKIVKHNNSNDSELI